jgi:hypothetical protein
MRPAGFDSPACDYDTNVEPYTLVVMEHGSEWPAHIKRTTELCLPHWQEPNEGHLDLLREVRTFGSPDCRGS